MTKLVTDSTFHGYMRLPGDVLQECLRDAQDGDVDSVLANIDSLSEEDFMRLLEIAERVLLRDVPE